MVLFTPNWRRNPFFLPVVFFAVSVAYSRPPLPATTTGATTEESTEKIMTMLQVRRVLPSAAVLPPYMIHLYKQLKEDKLIAQGSSNTIRSFFPFLGTVGGQDILVFNLTPVHDSEYIERVDLHLQYKRQTLWKKRSLRLSILKLDQDVRTEMVITVRRSSYGSWHTVDVTDGIISSLEVIDNPGTRHQMLVGLLVEEEDDDNNSSGKEKKTIVSALSNSFLVMFSEDDENLAIERVRTTNHSKAYFRYRERRDYLFGNELTSSIHKGEVRRKYKKNPETTTAGDSMTSQEEKQFSKTGQKGRKMRRLQLKWRKSWWDSPAGGGAGNDGDASEEENNAQELLEENVNGSYCHRESWTVDFARLGWSNWIIAPRRYDAYTCTGDCHSQSDKTHLRSNYASLRQILAKQSSNSRFRGNNGFCCVPQTMSYVPLLFYDENRNVVLKKFPEMKVDSCICR